MAASRDVVSNLSSQQKKIIVFFRNLNLTVQPFSDRQTQQPKIGIFFYNGDPRYSALAEALTSNGISYKKYEPLSGNVIEITSFSPTATLGKLKSDYLICVGRQQQAAERELASMSSTTAPVPSGSQTAPAPVSTAAHPPVSIATLPQPASIATPVSSEPQVVAQSQQPGRVAAIASPLQPQTVPSQQPESDHDTVRMSLQPQAAFESTPASGQFLVGPAAVAQFCEEHGLSVTPHGSTYKIKLSGNAGESEILAIARRKNVHFEPSLGCAEELILARCSMEVTLDALNELYTQQQAQLSATAAEFCRQHGLSVTPHGSTYSIKYNEKASESRKLLTMLQGQGVIFQPKAGCWNEFIIVNCLKEFTLNTLNNQDPWGQQQIPQSARVAAASSSPSMLTSGTVSMFSRSQATVMNGTTSVASSSTQSSSQGQGSSHDFQII